MEKNLEEKRKNALKAFYEPKDPMVRDRVPKDPLPYLGQETLEAAKAVLFSGGNLLLIGEKSTGKNVLAEYLAGFFQRPLYTVSFHLATDADSLIGTDTLKAGEVQFRPGPISQAALYGGFCVLDEINMAKNESVSVLHASLDHRRLIDLPGYQPIQIHPLTRFIATMNEGYAGTRPLNRALLSRFQVIRMPRISQENLEKLIKSRFPDLKDTYARLFTLFFFDLVKKAEAGEISDQPLDLRGLLGALSLVDWGLSLGAALSLGLVNKSEDDWERRMVFDLVESRFLTEEGREDLFLPSREY